MDITKFQCNCEESKDNKCPFCDLEMKVELHTTWVSQEYSSKPHQHMKKVCGRCGTVIWSYQMHVSKGQRTKICKKCNHAFFNHAFTGCTVKDCKCKVDGVNYRSIEENEKK